MPIKRMWGGRFEEAGDQLVNQFNASISFDQEMAQEDMMLIRLLLDLRSYVSD